MAAARLSEFASVIGAELLQLARSRLGPEFGRALAEYISALKAGRTATLASRVQAARDPGGVEMVLALAREVAAVAKRPVVLAVDAAERLSPDDLRLLSDVGRGVPSDVRLRLGFATYALEQRRAIERLHVDVPEVAEMAVGGLPADAIREWLTAENLDEALTDRLLRVTGGYPLFLADLVRQLEQGVGLDLIDRNARYAHLTRLAWDQLDTEARRCARLLAVLEDPMPEGRLRELCGLDAAAWGDVVQRLEHGMLLSTQVNGIPWFHEQRRGVVRDFLRSEEVDHSAGAATDALLAHINETGALERSGELAALAARSPSRQGLDPKLRAALKLDGDELAVAAALLELTERQAVGLLGGGEVLRHAHKFFGPRGDLIDALERLAAKELAVTAEAQGVTAVAPQFSMAAAAVIGGRAQVELGRLPVPAIGSLVFEAALAPRLNPFSEAQHGLGAPSMSLLSQWAAGRDVASHGSHYPRSRAELGHNLIIRGSYRERPLGAAVRFIDESDRDAALARLGDATIDVLGDPLSLRTVTPHPLPMVAPSRFVRAAERAAQRRFTRASALNGELEEPLSAPFTAEQAAQAKVEVTRLLAERCDIVESWAFGLDEPWGLHWYFRNDLLVEGEVRGGRPKAVQHADVPRTRAQDPFVYFRYERAFNLSAGERLVNLRFHAGPNALVNDPVLQVIGRLRSRAERFNASQARRRLTLDTEGLRSALLDARRRELDDARTLAGAVPLAGVHVSEPVPQALYALVAREVESSAGSVPGARASVVTEIVPSASGNEEVHVAIVPGQLGPGGWLVLPTEGAFDDSFGRSLPEWSWAGDLSTTMADLLGHSERELWFDGP